MNYLYLDHLCFHQLKICLFAELIHFILAPPEGIEPSVVGLEGHARPSGGGMCGYFMILKGF